MNIAFRVDASLQIGSGHLMRCLSLAAAFNTANQTIRFVCRTLPNSLAAIVRDHGYELEVLNTTHEALIAADDLPHSHWLPVDQDTDWRQTRAALNDREWHCIIVDHYALDERWESAARQQANIVCAIDDVADRKHNCDVLLDQNIQADSSNRYQKITPGHCDLLLGPRYALLRDEFLQTRESTKQREGQIENILVFFGGMDAENHTGSALRALSDIELLNIRVDVVIGAQHPNKQDILDACSASGFICHVQTNQISTLMANADLSIGAGGTAIWERCSLGLPTLTYCVADNQREQMNQAALNGMIYAPEPGDDLVASIRTQISMLINNPLLRTHISRAGMEHVDAKGALRVARKITQRSASEVTVRLATIDDAEKSWAWRNHENTRLNSFDSALIDLPEHIDWWKRSVAHELRILLIAAVENKEIGVLRFDIENDTAVVSIYLNPEFQGQGFGANILSAGQRWIFENFSEIRFIRAEVKADNHVSERVFLRAGFVPYKSEFRLNRKPTD